VLSNQQQELEEVALTVAEAPQESVSLSLLKASSPDGDLTEATHHHESSVCSVSNPSPKITTCTDQRIFSSDKYEQVFTWLYWSNAKRGYICKYCELFAPNDNVQIPYQNKGVLLGRTPSRQLKKHEVS